MKKRGFAAILLCSLLLCSCGGEKEETTTAAETPKFETTSNTSSAEPKETEPIENGSETAPSGGMTLLDEYVIGEGVDGVIDFSE